MAIWKRGRSVWFGTVVLIGLTSIGATRCGSTVGPDGLEATVRFFDVEGGCWGLVDSAGTTWEPLDLSEEFRKNGLEVTVTLEPRDDLLSVCQIGRLADVVTIEIR